MAKRRSPTPSDGVPISQTSRLLIAGGMFLVGAICLYLVVVIPQSDRNVRERAAKEARFVQTNCTVEDAASNTRRDNEGSEYTSMSVTFQVTVGAQTYKDIRYEYADYHFNKISAEKALARELAPGASITCFYDRDNPKDAVLVRRAIPTEDPPAPVFLWMFGAIGVIVMATGLYMAFSKKEWKAYAGHDTD